MQVFNTMGRKKEEFVVRNKAVSMYVCGITPYDTTHLGHARTYTFFDTFRRYLEFLGNRVTYIQNITDIDDPLFERARSLGVPFEDLVEKYVGIYFNDLKDLNIRPADAYPRVSQETGTIIRVIDGILAKGHAYIKGNRVYFSVKSFPEYGKLSQLDYQEMLQLDVEFDEDISDPRKEYPLDFLLWKPSAVDEPAWASPWGEGRPGWHIECSTMSLHHLGEIIDIHGGGQDLVFPHHENEIAQSESFTGKKPYVRYWLHSGIVRRDGVKMSKSLGNMIFVRDLLKSFSSNSIRLYLLGTHYREGLDYDMNEIVQAATLSKLLFAAISQQPIGSQGNSESRQTVLAGFRSAMDDDLNTPAAIRFVTGLAEEILSSSAPDATKKAEALRLAIATLGLDPGSP